jgi:hypothetical protein
MTLDPMTAAQNWLSAFRAKNIEALEQMLAKDVVVECSNPAESPSGQDGIRFLLDRPSSNKASSEAWDIQPPSSGASVSYREPNSPPSADLTFGGNGKICFIRCGCPEDSAASFDAAGA